MYEGCKFIFWFSAFGVFYIYVGYPVFIWLLARLFSREPKAGPFSAPFSVVIVAHNEAARLPEKIKSILQSDVIGGLAELIVASDGSTDGTVEVVRAIGEARVRVVEFNERRGKASVLNDVVPRCKTELVVLTDARQALDSQAIGKLLMYFANERVGVVSGELVFPERSQTTGVAKGLDFYWNYEKFIRKQESRFRSVPGATGALYVLRRSLFEPIPSATILDDVAIPMQVVAKGYRCILEEGAYVFDEPSISAQQESIRKRRTIGGNVQLAMLFPGWLFPWRNPIWFEFISHKMLRLLSPFLLLVLFVSAGVSAQERFYAGLFIAQCLFYGVSLVFRKWNNRLIGSMVAFVSLNRTTGLALYDALRGRFDVRWKKE